MTMAVALARDGSWTACCAMLVLCARAGVDGPLDRPAVILSLLRGAVWTTPSCLSSAVSFCAKLMIVNAMQGCSQL